VQKQLLLLDGLIAAAPIRNQVGICERPREHIPARELFDYQQYDEL
jgi:hypothetical protein